MKLKKNLILNKKGSSTIEIVIGLMMFVLVLGFLLDLIMLTWKFNVVGQTNTQIARIASIQGGVLSSAPYSYPGGDANYINIYQMKNIVEDKFQSAGISPNNWTVYIGNGRITSSSAIPSSQYDYKQDFNTSITVTYTWEYMSKMLPGNFTQTITSKRPAMSEWKYNYDSWIGE